MTENGFLRYGAAFWPGAHHFVLVATDNDSLPNGSYREVCHDCLMDATRLAAANPALELIGETEASDELCSLCGERL